MEHQTLITTLVAAVVLAFMFGFIAQRLRLSPIVGYLVTGVAVGPHAPGFGIAWAGSGKCPPKSGFFVEWRSLTL